MKKTLLAICITVFCACSNNKIAGTWVSVDTDSEGVISSGVLNVATYNADGSYSQKSEVQMGEAKLNMEFLGRWEMKEDKLIVRCEKAIISGSERENKKETEYTIVDLDDSNLELMSGGKVYKYRRKN